MKRLRFQSVGISRNQQGFIPMLIAILLVVACLVALVYLRVLHAQN